MAARARVSIRLWAFSSARGSPLVMTTYATPHFVTFAVEQDLRESHGTRSLVGCCVRMLSTVGGDGVIRARFVPQSVERMDVFKKTFARLRWRNRLVR